MYLEGGIEWNNTFNGHSVGALLLYNQSKYHSPDLAFLIPNGYQGVVGRVTYDYAGKYLAEVMARVDVTLPSSISATTERRTSRKAAVSAGSRHSPSAGYLQMRSSSRRTISSRSSSSEVRMEW
jgi:hypothetical protein